MVGVEGARGQLHPACVRPGFSPCNKLAVETETRDNSEYSGKEAKTSIFLIDTLKYLFICFVSNRGKIYIWLLPYSWAIERGRPILAVSILWLEPLSFLGTTITTPPQYF